MKRNTLISFIGILGLFFFASCAASKKKKKDLKLPGTVYHNLTSHYNGYFNAKEIYKKSVLQLTESHQDNYNQVLEMYPYVATDQEKSVESDMETAIQKVSVVVKLHRIGDWTDDCYLLLGKCRYLSKDYEGAQEAFEYLAAEYNPEMMAKRAKKKKKKKKMSAAKKKKLASKPDPKKFLYQRPAYQESMAWLARTYVERGLFDEADILLSKMIKSPKTHKSVLDDLAEFKAYRYLKEKEYTKAIEPLKESIDKSSSRKMKGRFTYILAQLYELNNESDKAYAAYDDVMKYGPTYEMEFNSKLSKALTAWQSGKEDSKSILRTLTRMSKDAKNKEYKDRIYFTMARINLKENDSVAAIANLRKSLQFNVNNKAQKAESYLLLGDLYFEQETYIKAKNYYDSTLMNITNTDSRFDQVTRRSENLEEIANNLEIIELQDSLLAIGKMSDREQRELAAKIIKDQKAKEAAAATASLPKVPGSATNTLGASKSSFFAYNDRTLKRGKKAFEKRWGTRTNEDNWRRSNRGDAGGFAEEEDEGENIDAITDEELKAVFKDIPQTPDQIAAANKKIMDAMFALGPLYRNKIDKPKKSVLVLEEMLERFPDCPHRLETYYNLYLAHDELGNKPRSKYYYNKIVDEFPNTTYARVLEDPEFLKQQQAKDKELTTYYDGTYGMFTKGDYKGAFNRAKKADELFGASNKMKPKFALLSAMCLGSMEGKDAYVAALKEVVAKYPETAEQKRAKEILRLLAGGSARPPKIGGGKDISLDPKDKPGLEVKDDEKDPEGKDEKPKDDEPVADVPKGTWKEDPNKSHYFMAVLKNPEDAKAIKDAVNAYNKANYSSKSLRANTIVLGTDKKNPILIVRRFRNSDDAMTYYNDVVTKKKDFLGDTKIDAEMFVVAQTNYREILKMKSVGDYYTFFEDTYFK